MNFLGINVYSNPLVQRRMPKIQVRDIKFSDGTSLLSEQFRAKENAFYLERFGTMEVASTWRIRTLASTPMSNECKVVKFFSINGEAATAVIATCETLYEGCDIAYRQPRNGSYVVIDELGEPWSMAELIGGGFSSLCTEHEHKYWKDWLTGDRLGVAG